MEKDEINPQEGNCFSFHQLNKTVLICSMTQHTDMFVLSDRKNTKKTCVYILDNVLCSFKKITFTYCLAGFWVFLVSVAL